MHNALSNSITRKLKLHCAFLIFQHRGRVGFSPKKMKKTVKVIHNFLPMLLRESTEQQHSNGSRLIQPVAAAEQINNDFYFHPKHLSFVPDFHRLHWCLVLLRLFSTCLWLG